MHFSARSDIVVIGQNPEMADYDNPRGDIHGLCWLVVAANERGDTWEMAVTGTVPQVEAERMAERLQARWDNLGKLPVGWAHWTPGRAVYGSDAYVAYGQADDLAWERRCDEDERLGLR